MVIELGMKFEVPEKDFRPEFWTVLYKANKLWIFPVIKPKKVKRGLLAFPCTALCGYSFRRPHLTCIPCQARRSLTKMGKIDKDKIKPELCAPYIMFVPYKIGKVRLEIVKKLLTLAEFFVKI